MTEHEERRFRAMVAVSTLVGLAVWALIIALLVGVIRLVWGW